MKELLQLITSFFKIGLFTFGGGLSMLPMLEREVIAKRGWCTKEEILDYYAVGQCTPGVIAVDVAAFIGYRQGRALGGILAPLALCAPGAAATLILAMVMGMAGDYPVVRSAFTGIRVAVCALLTASVVNIARESIKRWWQLALAVVAFAVVALFGQNPAWVVLGAGVLGVCGMFGKREKK